MIRLFAKVLVALFFFSIIPPAIRASRQPTNQRTSRMVLKRTTPPRQVAKKQQVSLRASKSVCLIQGVRWHPQKTKTWRSRPCQS